MDQVIIKLLIQQGFEGSVLREGYCHMIENNNLIKIILFIYYLSLKFTPELLLSTPIRS